MKYYHKNCGGSLELNWANGFGVCRVCNVCSKTFILPTQLQLKIHPDLISEFKEVDIVE